MFKTLCVILCLLPAASFAMSDQEVAEASAAQAAIVAGTMPARITRRCAALQPFYEKIATYVQPFYAGDINFNKVVSLIGADIVRYSRTPEGDMVAQFGAAAAEQIFSRAGYGLDYGLEFRQLQYSKCVAATYAKITQNRE